MNRLANKLNRHASPKTRRASNGKQGYTATVDLSDLRTDIFPQSSVDNSPAVIAQRMQIKSAFGDTMQQPSLNEEKEEPLQGRFATLQRQPLEEEEEEPVQGKFVVGGTTALQRKPNHTGLPDDLKAGVESLSGLSLDNVQVHFNSSQPAAVQAHAYTQGTDIHIAPGQERHLPHEAWHVVQQKRQRVTSTIQLKGIPVNDDMVLEQEADRMGTKAIQMAEECEDEADRHALLFDVPVKQNPSPDREMPFASQTVQRVKTRRKKEIEETKLRRQGLSLSNVREGKRRTRQPNRYGAIAKTYRDRHGNKLFNPGSSAILSIRMKLSGDSLKDIRLLVQQTGRGQRGSGEVWHHMGDFDTQTGKGTVVLVPVNIHEEHRHMGGSAEARAKIWNDPEKKAKYGQT